MSKKILGLNICSDSVSAVLIKSSMNENRIEASEHFSISEAEDLNDFITSSIKKIIDKNDLSESAYVVSLPADIMFFRNINVPLKTEKKIRQILPFELEPMLPFSEGDLETSFNLINLPVKTRGSELLTASIKKIDLNHYLNILASLNIEPEVIVPGGYSACACIAVRSDISEKLIFAYIEKKSITLFLIANSKVCLIRSIPSASGDLLNPSDISADIKHTVLGFEEKFHTDFYPSKLFITGSGLGEISNKYIEKELEHILDVPVERTDFAGISSKNTHLDVEKSGTCVWQPWQMDEALAIGMNRIQGTNGLNFSRGYFAAKKLWVKNKKNFIRTGILLIFVILCAGFNFFMDSYSLNKRLFMLNNRINEIFISTFPDVKKIVDPLQQMKVKINEAKNQSLFLNETGQNIRAVDILYNISELIPDGVDVSILRLVTGPDSILISGETDTFNSVDSIKNGLDKAEIFKTVIISSTSKDKNGSSISFKLKIEL